MNDSRFITLAVHSENFASEISSLLKKHGISVRSEPVFEGRTGIISGIRLRIPERDLPFALKISEIGLDADAFSEQLRHFTGKGIILIPVDFSYYSVLAVKIGFEFAKRLNLNPLIMHCYQLPSFSVSIPMQGDCDSIADPQEDAGMLQENALKAMTEFKNKIRMLQTDGEIENVLFSTAVARGIPEDVILQYTKVNSPRLVVMATRGKNKKEQELVGSVTAEVLDACRVPVFTVPDNYNHIAVCDIKNLVYFCNLDSQDVLSVDMLMRMFDYPDVNITLIPVNDRIDPYTIGNRINSLQDYFNASYPLSTFSSAVLSRNSFRENLDSLIHHNNIQLFVVPNKKKNIIARIFRPGMAHRILFERDMPMLALPV